MSEVITDTDFLEKTSEGLTLVDFWATWCGPCRMQGPILEKMSEEIPDSELKIYKMNVDENPAIAQKLGIMSIPTLLLMNNGKVVNELVGVHTADQIQSVIKGNKLMGVI